MSASTQEMLDKISDLPIPEQRELWFELGRRICSSQASQNTSTGIKNLANIAGKYRPLVTHNVGDLDASFVEAVLASKRLE